MTMKLVLSLLLFVGISGIANADIVLSGSTVDYTGPGQYHFEYYAEADGADYNIQSFSFPVDFAPGVSYVADSFATPLQLKNVADLPQPPFTTADMGFTSSIGSISIADGETALLFTYDLLLDATFVPGIAAIPVDEFGAFQVIANTNGSSSTSQIPVSQIGPQSAISAVTPVPEPTTALLLVGGGIGLGIIQRRRRLKDAKNAS
ncbi:PEP-CTERM sorting domain-containing protein [Blastopirellula marina]|uniref:Ice-binding protein C-terminal domain-containing protein n=1 Tax=Blastopirellula marina TaxID=124 RepID=A0A2S8G0Q0_9BACT|nr:PEP-CTERM sorting domain-containing protein [Blastopirellula marina]PQO38018.1 hypothetical protein C5Y98_07985 [Blastopirellula marina]PTL44674.1 PEP-CTERM sorting domain-containing protein [Blastopirellula marina]